MAVQDLIQITILKTLFITFEELKKNFLRKNKIRNFSHYKVRTNETFLNT